MNGIASNALKLFFRSKYYNSECFLFWILIVAAQFCFEKKMCFWDLDVTIVIDDVEHFSALKIIHTDSSADGIAVHIFK